MKELKVGDIVDFMVPIGNDFEYPLRGEITKIKKDGCKVLEHEIINNVTEYHVTVIKDSNNGYEVGQGYILYDDDNMFEPDDSLFDDGEPTITPDDVIKKVSDLKKWLNKEKQKYFEVTKKIEELGM